MTVNVANGSSELSLPNGKDLSEAIEEIKLHQVTRIFKLLLKDHVEMQVFGAKMIQNEPQMSLKSILKRMEMHFIALITEPEWSRNWPKS